MGDPIKRAELERLIADREKEISGLKKDYNINEQKKKADEIKLRENELDDLRKRFENEKDPVKKEELRRQMEFKLKEIEALKKKDQLTAEQQRQQENIMLKEKELEDLRKQWELETDPIKKAELE